MPTLTSGGVPPGSMLLVQVCSHASAADTSGCVRCSKQLTVAECTAAPTQKVGGYAVNFAMLTLTRECVTQVYEHRSTTDGFVSIDVLMMQPGGPKGLNVEIRRPDGGDSWEPIEVEDCNLDAITQEVGWQRVFRAWKEELGSAQLPLWLEQLRASCDVYRWQAPLAGRLFTYKALWQA